EPVYACPSFFLARVKPLARFTSSPAPKQSSSPTRNLAPITTHCPSELRSPGKSAGAVLVFARRGRDTPDSIGRRGVWRGRLAGGADRARRGVTIVPSRRTSSGR